MSLSLAIKEIQDLLAQSDFAAAERASSTMLRDYGNDPSAYAIHGHVLRRSGQHARAITVLSQANSLNPRIPNVWLDLARCYLAEQNPRDALHAAEQLLTLQPKALAGWQVAFDAAHRGAAPERAEYCFQQWLALDPRALERRLALGNDAFDRGDFGAASVHFAAVWRADPGHLSAALNLAATATQAHRYADAESVLRAALQRHPRESKLHLRLCELGELGKWASEKRLADASNWLRIEPQSVTAKLLYAHALADAADYPALRNVLDEVIAKAPTDDGLAARWMRLHYPRDLIFADDAGLDDYRREFAQGIEFFEQQLQDNRISIALAERLLRVCANFHFGYLADPDPRLPSRYGDLLRRLALASGLSDSVELARNERMRIGIVSAHCRMHSVSRVWRDLVLTLADQFELHVFDLGVIQDESTRAFANRARQILHGPKSIGEWHTAIRDAQLDALIYLDIGQEPISQALASLRLARVQLTTWGHPVTSGLPTIDAFLSSDLAEPADADRHYREPLLRLPGLAASYAFVEPRMSVLPADLRKTDGRVRLLCLQNGAKLLPEHDAMFARVLTDLPDAELLLTSGMKQAALTALQTRLQRTLGGERMARVRVLGFLDYDRYAALLASADLVLDSWHWSGGLTSFDALSMGVPIVTWPGELMRGRQTYAMLKLLGVEELIATDRDDYRARVVSLARDASARAGIRARLLAHRTRLYAFDEAARALSTALSRALRDEV